MAAAGQAWHGLRGISRPDLTAMLSCKGPRPAQEFMAQRAQEFRFDYMEVSTATDARLAQAHPLQQEEDYTHEEYMAFILRGKEEPFIPVRPPALAWRA